MNDFDGAVTNIDIKGAIDNGVEIAERLEIAKQIRRTETRFEGEARAKGE